MQSNTSRPLLIGADHREIELHNDLLGELCAHVCSILCIPDTDRSLWNRRLNRGIDSFTDEQIKNDFHFQNRDQLRMVFRCFRIPQKITLDNGCVVSGEEAFLVTVFRMAWPRKLTQIEGIFGRDYSLWSRVINFMLNFMVDWWSYLLFDNMTFWLPYLALMHSNIVDKIRSLGYNYDIRLLGLDLDTQHHIFGFIDNTITATCRPAGGPADDGINARRLDALIQRAFYTGWKKLHGLKLQSIDLPNGMTFHAYGPISCRHSDSFSFRESRIQTKLAELQENEEIKYSMYGDSAYGRGHLICARHQGDNLTPRQIAENKLFSSVRECIEWGYRDIKERWRALDYKKLLRIRNMPVGKMFAFALLLKNAHCCLNGNQTSNYFDCLPPTLVEWTSQGPRMSVPQLPWVKDDEKDEE